MAKKHLQLVELGNDLSEVIVYPENADVDVNVTSKNNSIAKYPSGINGHTLKEVLDGAYMGKSVYNVNIADGYLQYDSKYVANGVSTNETTKGKNVNNIRCVWTGYTALANAKINITLPDDLPQLNSGTELIFIVSTVVGSGNSAAPGESVNAVFTDTEFIFVHTNASENSYVSAYHNAFTQFRQQSGWLVTKNMPTMGAIKSYTFDYVQGTSNIGPDAPYVKSIHVLTNI